MSGFELGILLFFVLIALILLRMPIAIAMLFVGAIGYVSLAGWTPLMAFLKTSVYGRVASYPLSVIPLFILMGQLATEAGLSQALYRSARAWVGHWRGGLSIAAIGGCAAFGAICGSSTATAATMTNVSYPELTRYGYARSLATGCLAAGGTLGILIPPSIILIIYALLVEQSILDLFVAALIPGMIATAGYMIAVAVVVRIRPGTGPAAERLPWRERLATLLNVWPVAAIFALVLGGIYLGWFSPTEGAAIGAVAVGIVAVVAGGMRWQSFCNCLLETAKTTAFLFLILVGAELYNSFLALTQMPVALAETIAGMQLPPVAILVVVLLVYLVLGCVMDSLAMILLTVPVFVPVILKLDFGLSEGDLLIWFGILALTAVEVGLITPPIGINVFVIQSLARDATLGDVFRGIVPFLISDLFRVAIIIAVPATCLWLPSLK